MIYGYIVAFFGALATCASMAEMASMFVSSQASYWHTRSLTRCQVSHLRRSIPLGRATCASKTRQVP